MNHTKAILEIIQGYYSLPLNLIQKVTEFVEIVQISSNTTFIKENSPNLYDYFLLNGVARSYIINQEGENITISFFQDCTVLTPNVARTFEGLSTLNFEALTDIVIGKFKSLELVELMKAHPDIRNFANAVLQSELIRKSNKEIYNASLPAKERLIKFREQFPLLENLVPHPTIASYLGITNISLSRLRKDLAKQ